jgi:hypothetical protein
MIDDGYTVPEIAWGLRLRADQVRAILIKRWWPSLVA